MRLYILSDSTGNLARHMLSAFLTQFPPQAFHIRAHTFVQDDARLEEALDRVAAEPGIVFHAVVSEEHKQRIVQRCGMAGVPVCDLTGPFVQFLSDASGLKPSADAKRLHHVDEVYHRRIHAIEFAINHDDGLGLDTLHEADLVLTGISRTSKTPTTIYLAQQGYCVGNVALALGVDPPAELLALPARKVIGLVIDPFTLVEIRSRRQADWRMADTSYNAMDHVQREIKWSRRLFAERGWRTLDVTNRSVEETAGRILTLAGLPV